MRCSRVLIYVISPPVLDRRGFSNRSRDPITITLSSQFSSALCADGSPRIKVEPGDTPAIPRSLKPSRQTTAASPGLCRTPSAATFRRATGGRPISAASPGALESADALLTFRPAHAPLDRDYAGALPPVNAVLLAWSAQSLIAFFSCGADEAMPRPVNLRADDARASALALVTLLQPGPLAPLPVFFVESVAYQLCEPKVFSELFWSDRILARRAVGFVLAVKLLGIFGVHSVGHPDAAAGRGAVAVAGSDGAVVRLLPGAGTRGARRCGHELPDRAEPLSFDSENQRLGRGRSRAVPGHEHRPRPSRWCCVCYHFPLIVFKCEHFPICSAIIGLLKRRVSVRKRLFCLAKSR
jgi:hypothetical protein